MGAVVNPASIVSCLLLLSSQSRKGRSFITQELEPTAAVIWEDTYYYAQGKFDSDNNYILAVFDFPTDGATFENKSTALVRFNDDLGGPENLKATHGADVPSLQESSAGVEGAASLGRYGQT